MVVLVLFYIRFGVFYACSSGRSLDMLAGGCLWDGAHPVLLQPNIKSPVSDRRPGTVALSLRDTRAHENVVGQNHACGKAAWGSPPCSHHADLGIQLIQDRSVAGGLQVSRPESLRQQGAMRFSAAS